MKTKSGSAFSLISFCFIWILLTVQAAVGIEARQGATAALPLKVVAVEAWGEPLAFFNDKGLPSGGLVIDVIDLVLKEAQIPYKWVVLPRNRIEWALLNSEVGLRTNTNPKWTKEPEQHVFSKRVWIQEEKIVAHSKSPLIKSIEDLHGKTLLTVLGYHYPTLDENFRAEKIKRADGPNQDSVLKMLELERAFFAVVNTFSLKQYLQQNPQSKLKVTDVVVSATDVHFAVKKNGPHEKDLEKINSALERLSQSGALKKVLDKYW